MMGGCQFRDPRLDHASRLHDLYGADIRLRRILSRRTLSAQQDLDPLARQDRDAEIKRFQEAQKALNESNEKRLAEKDEQIANSTKEVAKLSKRVDELLKDPGGK